MTDKLITAETLRKWEACTDGYKRFCELFPEGATLKDATDGLIKDDHTDWADWLWMRCAKDGEYIRQTVIVAGDYGTAIAGDYGTATAGDEGTATARYRGTANAGYRGTAIAGDRGTATAGDEGTATARYRGTAIAGYKGTATAGDWGTAIAGYKGTATAGEGGVLSILFRDKHIDQYRRKIAIVGENGIEPNVPYTLNASGNFVRKEVNETEEEKS